MKIGSTLAHLSLIVQKLLTFVEKQYNHSLLIQLIKMCNFFSAFRCGYMKYDKTSGKFRASKKIHYYNFCGATFWCIFYAAVQIFEFPATQRNSLHYIIFSLLLCFTICGSAAGAGSIFCRKIGVLTFNWVISNPVSKSTSKELNMFPKSL